MQHVVAKLTIRPEKTEQFLACAKELIQATRKETGCLSYVLHQGTEPGAYFFIEDWASKAALDAHMQTEHFTRIIPQMAELSSAEPRLELTTPLSL